MSDPARPSALQVNGTTLHVEVVGEGRPCLCPHGGPGTDSAGLVRSLGALAEPLGLRMVFWDHRGHGRSEWGPVEASTQDQLVADMEGIRQALGLGPSLVIGVSWGGFLGLMHAARHPEAVTRLALVGASASHEFMPRGPRPTPGPGPPPPSGPPVARCGTARSGATTPSARPSRRSGPSTSTTSAWPRSPTGRVPTPATGWRSDSS